MHFGLYAAKDYEALDYPSRWEFIAYSEALDHVPQQRWLREVAGERPIVFEASDLASQHAAVRSGIGVAALPCFLATNDPKVVQLAVDAPPPERDMWLVAHADLRRAPAVRAVMDYLATLVAESGLFSPAV